MTGRRDFLRGLATLPLIGGSVALIGAPSAAAAPVTEPMLLQYANWLFFERRLLCLEIGKHAGLWEGSGRLLERSSWVQPDAECRNYPEFHFPRFGEWTDVAKPSTRAAVVMAASGFDWRAVPR